MTYQEILSWVQILVGLGSFAALIFYAGRHSEAQRNNGEDIKELKTSRTEQWRTINEHGNRITSLEATRTRAGRSSSHGD